MGRLLPADQAAGQRRLRSLVYISAATGDLNPLQDTALLSRWRAHNARHDITGVLLHKDGDFLQYLEGPEPELTLLYAHIGADPRHTHLIELLREPIARREFANWPLACFSARSYRSADLNPPDDALRRVLLPSAGWRSSARLLITTFWWAGRPADAA